MLDKFEKYLFNECKINNSDSIILAVSGGIDSVVMLDLFHKLNLKVSIAHCNFQLRGEESDADEKFVRNLAKNYNYTIYVKKFNTIDYANELKISIQIAARKLRYNWFEELRKNLNFNFIATAHNSDDQVETVLINLSRGTGLKGLTGMKPIRDKIIRPLLFASRKDIENYLKSNKLSYREDSSNKSLKYYRNNIRHKIIPEFEKITPGFKNNVLNTIEILNYTETIVDKEIDNFINNVSSKKNDRIYLNINKIKNYSPLKLYLFEFLSRYGFNATQVNDIINAFDSQPGKLFHSDEYKLVKDREYLIIYPKKTESDDSLIYTDTFSISNPVNLNIKTIEKNDSLKIPPDPKTAYLDKDKLIFPLTVRKWKPGDRFRPLGMKGFKKLSDFFSDNKLSIADKENVYVLESEGKIAWVMGYRIDERFKVTDKTDKVFVINLT
ncbi:MAG: tRNA lysidine(34) synthetase TilS [Marinilabiliales bacterium]